MVKRMIIKNIEIKEAKKKKSVKTLTKVKYFVVSKKTTAYNGLYILRDIKDGFCDLVIYTNLIKRDIDKYRIELRNYELYLINICVDRLKKLSKI